jgi:hypothetical protein
MTQRELVAEIERVIEVECLEARRVIRSVWVKERVLARHPSIEGDDADFALLCVAAHVGATVDSVVRRFRMIVRPEWVSPQLEFAGFSHVQRAYTITRDGESVIVPTERGVIRPDELRAKAKEHDLAGGGHLAHRDELYRLADILEAAEAA